MLQEVSNDGQALGTGVRVRSGLARLPMTPLPAELNSGSAARPAHITARKLRRSQSNPAIADESLWCWFYSSSSSINNG
jgi:hypothetical protein